MRGDSSPEVVRRVQEIVAELLGVASYEVREDAPLFSIGLDGEELLDSLDALNLAFMIGEEFGLTEALEDDCMELATVRDIARYVESRLTAGNARSTSDN